MITLDAYAKSKGANASQVVDELQNSLNPLEKQLVDKLLLVKSRAKRDG